MENDKYIRLLEEGKGCIKDEEGNVLVVNGDINERWKNYFYKFFNDKQTMRIDMKNLIIQEENQNFFFCHQIRKVEVKKALKKIDNEKAIGPDNISIEIWKCLEEKALFGLPNYSIRY